MRPSYSVRFVQSLHCFRSCCPNWQPLLDEAITKPGIVSEAYSRFHNYSIGNQLLAYVQCAMRGIHPGPISTYPGWKALGRYVKRGEKALTLCMPVTGKKRAKIAREDGTEEEEEGVFTRFVFRNHCLFWHRPRAKSINPNRCRSGMRSAP